AGRTAARHAIGIEERRTDRELQFRVVFEGTDGFALVRAHMRDIRTPGNRVAGEIEQTLEAQVFACGAHGLLEADRRVLEKQPEKSSNGHTERVVDVIRRDVEG